MPMKMGWFLYCARYSFCGYWNSWIDCQRHMFWFGALPDTSPFGCTGGMLFCHVVFGPSTVTPSLA